MQTVQQIQSFTQLNNERHLSGYQLLTILARNTGKLGLKQAEALTFMALASYWNGKPIFPKIKTLCENTNLSDKAVRNAINSLVLKGLLLKSKRGKNANVYSIVISAVLSTVESGTKDRSSAVHNTAPCNMKSDHEKLEHQHAENQEAPKPNKEVVVFLSNFSLKSVPASILAIKTDKNGKPIRSHAAYWNSFTDEQKREYLKAEEAKAEKLKKREELKKQQEAEKIRKRAEAEKLKNEPPFYTKFTPEEAYTFCLNYVKSPVTSRLIHKPDCMGSIVARMYGLDLVQLKTEACKKS